MYDKVAQVMNRDYGCDDMDGSLVEDYLRTGNTSMISAREASLIDELIEKFL
jgi:hypothetical protein